MQTDDLAIIDKKIYELGKDKQDYSFSDLRQKVEDIVKSVDIFMIDGEVDSKAVDLYLKSVINQRNFMKKEREKVKLDNSKETKYKFIEAICKKYEFDTKGELIKKIEELERKSNFELNEIYNSMKIRS